MLRGDRLEYGVWKSSTDTFIFSLKDHAGVGPVKMPILSNNTEKAVIHDSSYGPMFGMVMISVLPRMQMKILHLLAMLAIRISFQANSPNPTS